MSGPPACSPPDRNPRRARLATPPGSTDCHTHIFDSAYPLSRDAGYTPPDSSLDQMLHMHAQLGIERVVFTQPSVYGTDNSAILDAMAKIPQRARAVVALGPDVTDGELADLDAQGAVGVRLNLDNKGGMPMPLDAVPRFVDRIGELGWHAEFLFAGDDLEELSDLLRGLSTPVSIGHFGYMPAVKGTSHAPFQLLLELVREGNTWVKLSAPNRLGVGESGPWDEVVPLAQALLEAGPDRMLWASDWPHPNKFVPVANDADLLEQLERWAPDPETRRRVLVDNPGVLYGF